MAAGIEPVVRMISRQSVLRLLPSVLLAMLAGCAGAGALREAPADDCARWHAELDRAVAAAGVGDGGEYRPPGYLHLRLNRLYAALGPAATDGAAFDAWLRALAGLDLAAREMELRNLGGRDVAAELNWLRDCSRRRITHDSADAGRRERLRRAAQVPPDYSGVARLLGLYPFAVPFLNLGIQRYNRAVQAQFARPLAALQPQGRLRLWLPPAAPAPAPAEVAHWIARRDALGVPQLSATEWQRLAAAHAPAWWVDTASDDDLPGAPVWRGAVAALDTAQPVTYFMPAFGLWRGQVVPQLVYTVWFAARPPQKPLDSYAGRFDGLVWRVTLDAAGRPLAHDTVHPCGCYHYYFPVQPLTAVNPGSLWQEPVLVPQAGVPARDYAVRVQSATHYVERVLPLAQAQTQTQAGERQEYRLRAYRELLSLPRSDGSRRSLFRPDGLLAGSERLERLWLWPSGVVSPGAMRQWGRHATSFVGMSHFDDPAALERVFPVQGAAE